MLTNQSSRPRHSELGGRRAHLLERPQRLDVGRAARRARGSSANSTRAATAASAAMNTSETASATERSAPSAATRRRPPGTRARVAEQRAQRSARSGAASNVVPFTVASGLKIVESRHHAPGSLAHRLSRPGATSYSSGKPSPISNQRSIAIAKYSSAWLVGTGSAGSEGSRTPSRNRGV